MSRGRRLTTGRRFVASNMLRKLGQGGMSKWPLPLGWPVALTLLRGGDGVDGH